MIRLHHQLNGHESKQTLGNSERQGSLACCSSRGHQELDMTSGMNKNNKEPTTLQFGLDLRCT